MKQWIGIAAFLAAFVTTSASAREITPVIMGLDQPWGIAITSDGGVLVTERDGDLLHFLDGVRTKVRGVPRVAADGQGGLLDVTLPRDFSQSRQVLLTYSKPQGRGSGTALAVGTLSQDGKRLTDVRDLFESERGGSTGRHFGSRVVEARDGTLFVTIGDRGNRPSAQDRSNHNGTIIRVTRDGKVPSDNPYVNTPSVQPEIWSYGHRNPQGAGLDLQGNLWTAEHGAKGGDEVNRIKKGANFGWPVISYGVHYSGRDIGQGNTKAGMEQPRHYWDPSIAPSGLLVYSGALKPEWKGDILVGSLKFDYISRLDGSAVREVEQIKSSETDRVRDIIEAPDGSIWFISVGNGTVYRMVP